MACIRRENTGSCSHFQCPFYPDTPHGYLCVEIFYHESVGFCETGEGCNPSCQYAFTKGADTPVARAAEGWGKQIDEELRQFQQEFLDENPQQ